MLVISLLGLLVGICSSSLFRLLVFGVAMWLMCCLIIWLCVVLVCFIVANGFWFVIVRCFGFWLAICALVCWLLC